MGAVASVVLGLASGMIFLGAQNSLISAAMLAPLPIAGIVLGIVALVRIRKTPDYLSGAGWAKLGIALSLACLIGGMATAGYVYATEVPEGYTRTSFIEFAPDQQELAEGVDIPPEVEDLDGKKVFLKGYIRPGSIDYQRGFRKFLLVRDNNECCYGDLSKVKYFDQVRVTLDEDILAEYSGSLFRVGGTLHILPSNIARGSEYAVYELQADYLK